MFWNGNALSKTILLNCPDIIQGIKLNNIYYIDTIDEVVGKGYFDKNKEITVYDWWFKNIKFEKHLITFYDPTGSLGDYIPKIAPLNKTVIDRRDPSSTHYYKDQDDLPSIIKKLPLDLVLQAAKILEWKKIGTNKCKMYKIPTNVKFVSKKERNNEIDKIEKEYMKNKNKNKF